MALIKKSRVVADNWTYLGEADALPSEGAVIVTLEQWQTKRDDLLASGLDLGVLLNSDQSPEGLEGDLSRLQLVALNFPGFADGRAFTYGRMLRERYGFEGEVRAVGGFIYDQIDMLRRCGFDAFETENPAVVKAVTRNESADVTLFYQPSVDKKDETVSSLRRRLLDSHKELGYKKGS